MEQGEPKSVADDQKSCATTSALLAGAFVAMSLPGVVVAADADNWHEQIPPMLWFLIFLLPAAVCAIAASTFYANYRDELRPAEVDG